MDIQENDHSSGALEFLCRHLVALYVTCQVDNEDPQVHTYSGTVICIRGLYFFLTAGHALKGLDEAIKSGRMRVLKAFLVDVFGSERVTDEPIPFDFINGLRAYIDDEEEGLDFGIIGLHPHYVRLLGKNGIKVISEENWINQHTVKFDGYAMLGLPDEFNRSNMDNAYGEFSPTLIPVKRLEQPPPDHVKRCPRFVGQLHPNLEITSIRGMSGGPIIGFSSGPPARYWVVAIQSSWLPQDKITFGCPLRVLGELIAIGMDHLEGCRDSDAVDDPTTKNEPA